MSQQQAHPSTPMATHGPCGNQGISLVEMVTVIAICAVLSGIAVTTLASLFQLDRSTNDHMAQRTALHQLFTRLRKDLHHAIVCQWNADSSRLVLQYPQRQQVEYAKENNRWIRSFSRQDDGQVKTSYPLDAACQWSCKPPAVKQGALVYIDINIPALTGQADSDSAVRGATVRGPALRCAVVAIVGRDHQLFHDNP